LFNNSQGSRAKKRGRDNGEGLATGGGKAGSKRMKRQQFLGLNLYTDKEQIEFVTKTRKIKRLYKIKYIFTAYL